MPSLPLGLVLPPDTPGEPCHRELSLEPGDLLLFYSDGVTDMQNRDGEFYEEGRLEAVLRREAHGNAQHVVQAVVEDLRRFQDGASQTDDVTLLALRRQACAGGGSSS
jgi:sigma-B regulation protein RsbU (phosphoserine phosphatase)